MLGFGGHFSTKSRRYSTTLGALLPDSFGPEDLR
jgi:cytidine deaminase